MRLYFLIGAYRNYRPVIGNFLWDPKIPFPLPRVEVKSSKIWYPSVLGRQNLTVMGLAWCFAFGKTCLWILITVTGLGSCLGGEWSCIMKFKYWSLSNKRLSSYHANDRHCQTVCMTLMYLKLKSLLGVALFCWLHSLVVSISWFYCSRFHGSCILPGFLWYVVTVLSVGVCDAPSVFLCGDIRRNILLMYWMSLVSSVWVGTM